MAACSMCHNDTLGDSISLDRLDEELKVGDDPQLELLSAIHAGPGTGLAADALVSGDAAAAQRKLMIAAAFCVFFMVAEAVGGYIANSLAIMTDAAHLLADLAGMKLIALFFINECCSGFLISVFALWLSARPATEHLSFGWYRTEIIGALLSIILIWVVTGGLFVEAFYRLQNPAPIDGKLMLILACIGLFVNGLIAFVLHSTGHSHGHSHSRARVNSHAESTESESEEVDHPHSHSGQNHGHSHSGDHGHSHSHAHSHSHSTSHGHSHSLPAEKDLESPLLEGHHSHEHDLNIRAAIIHAIGDMIQSIGVIIASVLIWYHPHWVFIDPICTFGFGVIVLFSTLGLLRECLHVLMEGAPAHINNKLVRRMLENIAHVRRVHDLHIWSIKPGRTSLSVHLEVDKIGHQEAILSSSQRILKEQFGIIHTTIQVEPVGDDCKSDCG